MYRDRFDERILILDTETTGLDPTEDRIVEIGCIELVNRLATGRHFHCYVNPGRPMPKEAELVHGLSDDFLADKPRFHEIVDDFLAFIGDSPIVAHNAMFDLAFINYELSLISRSPLPHDRCIDTLTLARQRVPGAKHSLDALCTRFGIDRSNRVKHGALLDADLLAQVFVELTGGLQIGLALDRKVTVSAPLSTRRAYPPRAHGPSPAELAAHQAFLAQMKEPLWLAR